MNFEKLGRQPAGEKDAQKGPSLKYESGVGLPFDELLKERNNEAPNHQEIDTAEVGAEKILSATEKINKLTTQGEQRVTGLEREIDLSPEDIAAVRSYTNVARRLQKIGAEASALFGKFKEKVSGLLIEQNTTNKKSEEPQNAVNSEYDELKEQLKYEQREISRPVIEEARKKRDQILEARGLLKMSKADFDEYFGSKDFEVRADLRQQNVGDCYAVAAIHAMSRSPHFEMICRSGMKRNRDGSWQVRIPLMSESGQTVTITPDELIPQRNKQFLKQRSSGEIMPDLRWKLRPVKGKEGLQALEAAFIKTKFGTVDRLEADKGGRSDQVLLSLGGDNFQQYSLSSVGIDKKTGEETYLGLDSLDPKKMAYLDHFLENFDPEVHIATAGSKYTMDMETVGRKIISQLGFYKGKGTYKFFVPEHYYSILDVDPKNKIVKLANPWNTSKPIELTFDQFKGTFFGFEAIRVDSAKLLTNMQRIEQKAA